MTITRNIKELRTIYGLSQEDVATAIGVGRSTMVAIEQGKRELTSEELGKLADFLGIDLYELLSEELPDYEKYREMLIAFFRDGANPKGNIPKTKLAKLLYLADFAWFYDNLKPMSGMKYRRLTYGPVPDQFFRVVDEMVEEGKLKLEVLDGGAQMLSLTPSSQLSRPERLRKAELTLISNVAKRWKTRNTQEIVDFTHQQLPWQICRPNEFIPYELITQEEKDYVY